MSERNQLLELITCCFGPCPEPTFSGYDLLMFSLGSIVIASMLLSYYNRIPKSNNLKSDIDNPIYLSKDSLLQTTNSDANLILVEKTTSIFTKFLVYAMIAIVAFTPLYQLLGIEHFV